MGARVCVCVSRELLVRKRGTSSDDRVCEICFTILIAYVIRWVCVFRVCACVCVCVREGGGSVYVSVCVRGSL